MTLDPRLLEILACPDDKGPLLHLPGRGWLVNPRTRRAYRIDDGIPVMLVDEAHDLTDDEWAEVQQTVEAEGITPTFDPGSP